LQRSCLKFGEIPVKWPMMWFPSGSIIGHALRKTNTFKDAAQIFSFTQPSIDLQCPSVILSSPWIAIFNAFSLYCFAFSHLSNYNMISESFTKQRTWYPTSPHFSKVYSDLIKYISISFNLDYGSYPSSLSKISRARA
jgi:hypothetical protein